MNQLNLEKQRQENKKLLDWSVRQNHERNVVVFGENESLEHMLKKAEFCYELNKRGKQFYTEAKLKNSLGRADIFVLDGEPVAIEIMASETESKILEKKLKYPCMVVEVRMNQSFEEVFGE